jgi:hypothetical protein
VLVIPKVSITNMSLFNFFIFSSAVAVAGTLYSIHNTRNQLLEFRVQHAPMAEAAYQKSGKVTMAVACGVVWAMVLLLFMSGSMKANPSPIWDVISLGLIQLFFVFFCLIIFNRRVVILKNGVLYVTMFGGFCHYADEDLLGGYSRHTKFNSGSTTIKFPKGQIIVSDQWENQYQVVRALIQRTKGSAFQ